METTNPDVKTWGVAAHGGTLFVDAPAVPPRNLPWVIDIENNQDGSCAGIGVTCDGCAIFFYSNIRDEDFFVNVVGLIGHNIKYDIQMLRKWGFNVNVNQICWDTQVAEYVRNSTTNLYGLKDLNKQKFGISYPTFEELCGKGKKAVSVGTLPLDVLSNYNGMDVLSTYKHYIEQLANMSEDEHRYTQEIELPATRTICEIEERGVLIDTSYIRGLDKRFTDEISTLSNWLRGHAGDEFNPNSHIQVKRHLLEAHSLSLNSTAAEELAKHVTIPFVASLLRYRTLSKLKGTYTEGLIERSGGEDKYRLHARFNQTVTHTGRLSSSDPNLQNIPTRAPEGDAIREGFISAY